MAEPRVKRNIAWDIFKIQANISITVGLSVGLAYALLTVYLPFTTPSLRAHPWFNLGVLMLIGLASGMLGWGIGIFLSPIGSQVKSAAALASAFASFWTGVVVSHIEVITRFLVGAANRETGQAAKVRLLFAGGVFLMSLFITINSRFPEHTVNTAKGTSQNPTSQ
ncbi:hypothetical protein [Terriglobus sp. TAA 43]|uniref:hypothetical protein n=1 Tax=Terriglobus sp. TAA 43 TaxID=278961 RepID=UPI000648B514|nr:hypothetical protein [Terriglobus sp. TAA 43]